MSAQKRSLEEILQVRVDELRKENSEKSSLIEFIREEMEEREAEIRVIEAELALRVGR